MLDPILHVPLRECAVNIRDCLAAGLVPFLRGSPGLGKSAIFHSIAAEMNLELIDARFAGFDPTDLNGFPQIDDKENIARYYPLETFPLENRPLPEGKDGWLVLCDELNSAPHAVQAASYKLFLDRMVGQRKLHPKAYLAAAGNLDTDGAITVDMSSALINRVVNLACIRDLEYWMEWAEAGNIRPLITSFLRWKSATFYTFDNTNPDQPFASPRSWEGVNKLLNVWNGNPLGKVVPMAGLVNLGVATEFEAFARLRSELPTKSEVLASPLTARQPGLDNPGGLYALTGALGDWITPETIGELMGYINRMPAEFQVVTIKSACRKDRTLLGHAEVSKWVNANAKAFIN